MQYCIYPVVYKVSKSGSYMYFYFDLIRLLLIILLFLLCFQTTVSEIKDLMIMNYFVFLDETLSTSGRHTVSLSASASLCLHLFISASLPLCLRVSSVMSLTFSLKRPSSRPSRSSGHCVNNKELRWWDHAQTRVRSLESLCVVVVMAVTKVDGLRSVSLITPHRRLTGTRDEMETLIPVYTPASPGFTWSVRQTTWPQVCGHQNITPVCDCWGVAEEVFYWKYLFKY